MNDLCKSENVKLQENGIIRNSDGLIIGKLITYEKLESDEETRLLKDSAISVISMCNTQKSLDINKLTQVAHYSISLG
jgi:hypothetical protein